MYSYSPCCTYQQWQQNHHTAGILTYPALKIRLVTSGQSPTPLRECHGVGKVSLLRHIKGVNPVIWLSRLVLNHEMFLCSEWFRRRPVIYICNIKIIYCRFVAKSSQEFLLRILIVWQKSINLSFLGLWPKPPEFLHKSQDYKSEGNISLRFCLDLSEAFFTQSRIQITRAFLA